MVDTAPEFETGDNLGTTSHFNSTVGTTAVAVPSVAGNNIDEFFLYNPYSNSKSSVLLFSMDGGSTFTDLPWNSSFSWTPKGTVKQIFIKANAAATAYQFIINVGAA